MYRCKIESLSDGYRVRSDSEVLGEGLNLVGVAEVLCDIYRRLPRPEHRNPDALPPRWGIDVSYDDDPCLEALATLCLQINKGLEELGNTQDMMSANKRRLREIHHLSR